MKTTIANLHTNHALMMRFWLEDGEGNDSLLDQLDTAIYQSANADVYNEATVLIEKLKEIVYNSLSAAENQAKDLLKSA